MRIDCVAEVVYSSVAGRVGELRSAQESKREETVFSAVTVFAVVEKCKSVIFSVKVDEFMRAYFELRPLYLVVFVSGAVEVAELNITGNVVGKYGRYEIRSQHLEVFVPVCRSIEFDHIPAESKYNFLHERGFVVFEEVFSYEVCAVDVGTRGLEFEHPLVKVDIVDIYIPRVVELEGVGIYREFVEVFFYEFLVARLVDERSNLAVCAERNLKVFIFDSIVGVYEFAAVYYGRSESADGVSLKICFVPVVVYADVLVSVEVDRVDCAYALFARESLEHNCFDFFKLVVHNLVSCVRFVVNSLDRRAGEYVVELIQEYFFPYLLDLFSVVAYTLQVSDRAQPFYLVQKFFDASVPFFAVSLRGVATLVSFVVQFSRMRREYVGHIFYVVKEVDCGRGLAGSKTVHIFLMAHKVFDMTFAGAAAAVSVSEHKQSFFANIFFGVSVFALLDCKRRHTRVIVAERFHMRDKFCSVKTYPVESTVGETVEIVGAEFDCHKVIHSALFEYLRKRCGETEHVGQPAHSGFEVEFVLPVFLTVQTLSDPRFSAREVAVAFDPHTALKLYSSFLDVFLYSFEKFGIFFFEPYKHLRLGLCEVEIVVECEIAYLIGKSTSDFTFGFADRPQPRKVDMSVTYAVVGSSFVFGFFLESRF